VVDWFTMTPMYIWNATNLTDKEKICYSLLTSLTASKWYSWASNEYIANELGVTKTTISRNISSLKEKWYIDVHFNNSEPSNTKRKIYIASEDMTKEILEKRHTHKWQGGICTDVKQINNINKDIYKYISLVEKGVQIKEKSKTIKLLNNLLSLLVGEEKLQTDMTALQAIDIWNNIDVKYKFKKVSLANLNSWVIKAIKKEWLTIRTSYNKEEFYTWIENYMKEIDKRVYDWKPNSYFDHRFTLLQFLNQKNWLLKYTQL